MSINFTGGLPESLIQLLVGKLLVGGRWTGRTLAVATSKQKEGPECYGSTGCTYVTYYKRVLRSPT